jgi:hypothetical protein
MRDRITLGLLLLAGLAYGQPYARKADFQATALDKVPVLTTRAASPIAGRSVAVPASTLDTLPHLAVGGGFESHIYLVNTGAARAKVAVKWHGDNGAPLALEIRGANGQAFIGFEDELDPLESVVIELVGGPEHKPGSARLVYDFNVTTFSAYLVFRDQGEARKNQEATTWLMDRDYRNFAFVYENFGSDLTGVAFANTDPLNAVTVNLEFRSRQGQVFSTGQFTVSPNGHKSFVLDWEYPQTEDKSGLVVARCSAATCAASALRFTAAGPYTTIPILTSYELDRQ